MWGLWAPLLWLHCLDVGKPGHVTSLRVVLQVSGKCDACLPAIAPSERVDWSRLEPGCSISLLCGFLWACSPGRAIPLALSETQRRQCAAPPLDWPSARPGHTLPHCTVLSTQLLLQLLIPEPVLSQLLSSEPVGGGGWTLLAQAWDGWQLQLWVALFLQPAFRALV